MKVYKIRHKKSGKYAQGGKYGGLSEMGKTWTKLCYIKAHLKLLSEQQRYRREQECEIIVYELTEISTIKINDCL